MRTPAASLNASYVNKNVKDDSDEEAYLNMAFGANKTDPAIHDTHGSDDSQELYINTAETFAGTLPSIPPRPQRH